MSDDGDDDDDRRDEMRKKRSVLGHSKQVGGLALRMISYPVINSKLILSISQSSYDEFSSLEVTSLGFSSSSMLRSVVGAAASNFSASIFSDVAVTATTVAAVVGSAGTAFVVESTRDRRRASTDRHDIASKHKITVLLKCSTIFALFCGQVEEFWKKKQKKRERKD